MKILQIETVNGSLLSINTLQNIDNMEMLVNDCYEMAIKKYGVDNVLRNDTEVSIYISTLLTKKEIKLEYSFVNLD